MTRQIAKLPAALAPLASLALMFFLVPPAEALERVCMRGNPGIAYVFRFRVFWESDRGSEDSMTGQTGWSGDVHLAQPGCVDVSDVPGDSRMMIEMREINFLDPPDKIRKFCRDWDNDGWGVAVAHPDLETLWLDAWGTLGWGNCKLWKFE